MHDGVVIGMSNRIININRMELGAISLLKLTALAGLTILSYFKAKRIVQGPNSNTPISPNDPIITPILPQHIQKQPAPATKVNSHALITYDQFVSIYSELGPPSSIEEEWEEGGEETWKDEAKSDQFSTMGGDTRRETMSIPSEDPYWQGQECFEQCPSTPNRSIKQALHRQWIQRTKFLRREPHSACKPKNRIRKERFARRGSNRGELKE